MLTSGLLQVEIDSTRIHDGNQDVDILRRDVKYLQDELKTPDNESLSNAEELGLMKMFKVLETENSRNNGL